MITTRFSMSINHCNMAIRLALGCWTREVFSQKKSRLHQTDAQQYEASLWADWKLPGAGFVCKTQLHWRALQSKLMNNLHFRDAWSGVRNSTRVCKLVTGQAQDPPQDLGRAMWIYPIYPWCLLLACKLTIFPFHLAFHRWPLRFLSSHSQNNKMAWVGRELPALLSSFVSKDSFQGDLIQ